MKTVYALYHASRTMPLGVFDTEKLAFEALNHYAPLFGGDKPRSEFDVVRFPVHNKMSW